MDNRKHKKKTVGGLSDKYAKIRASEKRSNHQSGEHHSRKNSKKIISSSKPIRLYYLGGINEVGKNNTVIEYDGDMIIIDCGLSFPDETMPGVDIVVPDFSFIEENRDKIKGIFITHGHEDHIGGLSYLLKSMRVPVYGTKLTIGLISGKLKEHGLLGQINLHNVQPGETIKAGKFSVEFIHVNHSIPDAVAFAIKCEGGTVVHTGDFKIDTTPIDGDMIDLSRFGELGKEGVLLMMSDSTNAERPGFTESEKIVGESFSNLFRQASGKRIIVATFSSNIHRVQQIINVSKELGRKVALSGRSLENALNISKELGYLDVPDNMIIPLETIDQYPDGKLVLITTGSQGEPMSALTRMASSEHKKVKITPNDFIIISATPIPGNEKTVSRVVNSLLSLGAGVVYEKMYDVHVSGHACSQELKIMLGMIKPKYFIPVHGEKKHLVKHKELAMSVGIPKDKIILAHNGSAIEVCDEYIRELKDVKAGEVMTQGSRPLDAQNVVVNDRKKLAISGMIAISISIDSLTNQVVSYPEIVSRGFMGVRENADLIEQLKQSAYDTANKQSHKGKSFLINAINENCSKIIRQFSGANPLILVMLNEVY